MSSRPEKDHPTQLHAFHQLLERFPEHKKGGSSPAELVLVGGSRNAADAARVDNLRALAKELGIEVRVHLLLCSHLYRVLTAKYIQDQVRFVVNAPFPEMLQLLSRASIGLNTMVEEHFGINVVEFMVRPFAVPLPSPYH